MSFETALSLTSILGLFILASTMANLLARITRLERFAQQVAGVADGPGPAPGLPVPAPAELLAVTGGRDPARLVFVSSDCPACEDAIDQLQQWPDEARRATLLLYRDEPGADFVAPAGVRVVSQADAAFRSLAVRTTPTFMQLEDGVIVGRSTDHAHALTDHGGSRA